MQNQRFIARLLNAGIYSGMDNAVCKAEYPILVEAQPHHWASDLKLFGTDYYCVLMKGELERLGFPALDYLIWVNNPSRSDVPAKCWEMVADVSPSNPFSHWNRLKTMGVH